MMTLELPDWAVDEDILDRIEALVLSIHAELGDGEDIRMVLDQLDDARQYIGVEP